MSDEPATDEPFKLVVLGQPKVGKTSLVQRFVHHTFHHQVPAHLRHDEKKDVALSNGRKVTLNIFDLADQAKVDILTKQFYDESNAVIYVYNVMDEQSFYDVSTWIRDLEIYLNTELHKGLPILFVGNKKDLRVKGSSAAQAAAAQAQQQASEEGEVDESRRETRPITLKQVHQFIADQQRHKNYKFLEPLECSSFSGEGVDGVFVSIASALADVPVHERKKFPCNIL